MPKPLNLQLFTLPFKAVLLQCLDGNGQPIKDAYASGFIRREKSGVFLYTCWHVVTGYNKHDIRIRGVLPNRMSLQVLLQDVQTRQPGVTAIGGNQLVTIPLYDAIEQSKRPRWLQDEQDIPNADLNAIQLRVPFWHDAVKIPLPENVRICDLQIIDEADSFTGMVELGDRVLVVGYPYGFSTLGQQQPTPVVLTRFIAGTQIADRQQELLLESFGAPGMSGGPVFVDRDSRLLLLGLYTGLIFPDYVIEKSERATALGTCCNMMLSWEHLPLVPYPRDVPQNAT